MKLPGYLWAAHYASRENEGRSTSSQIQHVEDPKVPTGFRYILLIGAKNAGVFGNSVPSEIHTALSEQGRNMLAMQIGERVNLMTEASRCEGQAGNAYKGGTDRRSLHSNRELQLSR